MVYYTVFNPTDFACNHKYLLFGDALPTCFCPCSPSSGGSFTKEFIINVFLCVFQYIFLTTLRNTYVSIHFNIS